MFRVLFFLLFVAVGAMGMSWLADNPGDIAVNWGDYKLNISLFAAVCLMVAILIVSWLSWAIISGVFSTPAAIGNYVNRRRQSKGLEALSTGMIAIGAGDQAAATRYALQARRALPNEPMTHLLRAQAAQLSGDKATSRRIFEAMLAAPDTEQLGLRGLYLEAERENETEAAKHFAERAVKLNPKLGWAVDALFSLQCKSQDWDRALETVAIARKNGHIEKVTANRRRAVLLTAKAQPLEEEDQVKALALATEAHKLAPDLVPAGAIAGRILAARGNTPRATKIIRQTWSKAPHPDLATAYAFARLGDSPRDRLERVKKLTSGNPYSLEAPIAVATAAIDAREFDEARKALAPLLKDRLTQRVCTLMARIESEDTGNTGAVREWLSRAVTAPRDPAWTADGVVSNAWAPLSPVTGALDSFQWRVPVDAPEKSDNDLLVQKLEEFAALGGHAEKTIEAREIAHSNAATSPGAQPAKPNQGDTIDKEKEAAKTFDITGASAAPGVAFAMPTTTPAQADVESTGETAGDRARTTPAQNLAPKAKSETAIGNGNGTTKASATPVRVEIDDEKQPSTSDDEKQKVHQRSNPKDEDTRLFVSPPAPDDPGIKRPERKVNRDPANPYRRVTS
ncbi:MAG: heme biosynthesis protein HemY [Hyphomicrobiaceae bacterium]